MISGENPCFCWAFFWSSPGSQLITIGLLADVLMRTYFESQNKTPFKIKRIISGEAQDK